MGYYDYSNYFMQLINTSNDILLYLKVFIFIFTCYFLWKFISSMIRGRY